jgi:hypothetical protein
MKKTESKSVAALWLFPKDDFAQWRKACAEEDDFESFEEYEANLQMIKSELESEGVEVILFRFPVASMLEMLEQRGLENIPSDRSQLLASLASETDHNDKES